MLSVTNNTCMSLNVRKRTFWQVRPTNTQISLRIRASWPGSSLSALKNAPLATTSEDCSDCANAQADLSLRWVHISEGTFSDVTVHCVWFIKWAGPQNFLHNCNISCAPREDFISLRIRAVWSGSSLSILWVAKVPVNIHAWVCRLIWV